MARTLKVEEDGVTHINIFTRGATELGRLLTNPAYSPFTHPTYGDFDSVEGLWYWLKSGRCHDFLRTSSGISAKLAGRHLPEVFCQSFKEDVSIGIRQKIGQNPRIIELLAESTLPFEHYYWFGGLGDAKVIRLPNAANEWVVELIEKIRSELKRADHVAIPLVHIGQPRQS